MTLFNQVCTLLLHNLALVKDKFSTAHSDLYSVCVNEVMITVRKRKFICMFDINKECHTFKSRPTDRQGKFPFH